MEFYQPFQNLSYVYLTSSKALFIGSNLQVFVDAREGIGNYADFPDGSGSARISLLVNRDLLQDTPNVIMQQVLMKITDTPTIPFNPADLATFKEAVKKVIDADMKIRGISFYTVTAAVTRIDGSPGGQVTNTINKDGGIEII
jgi:hypothetical protein